MLGLLMMSAMALAGVSLVFGDDDSSGSDETASDTDDTVGGGSNSDDLVQRIGFVEIDEGDRDLGDLGYVEYLGNGNVVHTTDAAPLTEIVGTDLNQTFFGYSGGAIIDTGDGANSVRAGELQEGIILAGSGDTVLGSDVQTGEARLGIVLDGGGRLDGGWADELAVGVGTGATLNGGDGDDLLFSESGAAILNGGAGDDFIDAAAFENEYNQTTNQNQGAPDAFADVIDAGAGDDRVEDVANGDTVTLGDGNDLALGWYDADIALDPVMFTDFEPSEDRIILSIQGFPMGTTGDPDADYDLSGRFEFLEADGDSHLFVDDVLVAVFANTSGLSASSAAFIDESRDIYEARLVLG